jgi:hypothetical protein
VAIDDAGDYMAACSGIGVPLTVYFFGQAGDLKWSWGVNADKLSISSNGATLAVGTPIATTGFLLSTGVPDAYTCERLHGTSQQARGLRAVPGVTWSHRSRRGHLLEET